MQVRCSPVSDMLVDHPSVLLQTTQQPPSLHWGPPIEPRMSTSHDIPPALQDQQHSTAPAVMHHLPRAIRHHHQVDTYDVMRMRAHHHISQAAVLPYTHNSEAANRRPVREAPGLLHISCRFNDLLLTVKSCTSGHAKSRQSAMWLIASSKLVSGN